MNLKELISGDVERVFINSNDFAIECFINGNKINLYLRPIYEIEGEPLPDNSRFLAMVSMDIFNNIQKGDIIELPKYGNYIVSSKRIEEEAPYLDIVKEYN